jgi:hypothetical protein
MTRQLSVVPRAVALVLATTAGTCTAADRPADLRLNQEYLVGQKQHLIQDEIGMLGLAIEHYASTHREYPGPTGAVGTAEFLEPFLVPKLLDEVPEADAWGMPYLYWSDGVEYFIISFSADRQEDLPYESLLLLPYDEAKSKACGGEVTDVAKDVVYTAGNLCQWLKK